MQINFNSRPSARGDWLDVGFNVTRPNISIHAPPRGATQRPPRPALAIPFQFTPLREGRPSRQQKRQPPARFQFTPLREGRLDARTEGVENGRYFNSRPSARGDAMLNMSITGRLYFNSRPSARGDVLPRHCAEPQPRISIHAPPRGATRKMKILNQNHLFQFTPLREGRRYADRIFQSVSISIHAPPRGATKIATGHVLAYQISIHAPPRGATALIRRVKSSPAFQFTPLREGRQILAISHDRYFIKFQFTPLREGRLHQSN